MSVFMFKLKKCILVLFSLETQANQNETKTKNINNSNTHCLTQYFTREHFCAIVYSHIKVTATVL